MNVRFTVWIGELIVREWLDYSKCLRVNECRIYDVDRGIGMNGCKFYGVDRGIDS